MPAAVLDIGAVSLVGLALMALLLLMGAEALSKLLALAFSKIPVVGGTISRAITGAVAVAVGAINPWLQSSITPLIDFIAWPFVQIGPLFDVVTANLENAGGAIAFVGTTLLGSAIGTAEAAAHSAVTAAEATLGASVSAVESEAHSLFATAEADIATGLAGVTAYAGQVAGEALATAEADVAGAKVLAAAEVAQLAGVVAGNQQALEQLVTGGLSDAEARIDAAVAAAENSATSQLEGLRTWVQQQEGALQAGLTGALGVGLAGVIAQIATVATELTQYRQTCGDPLCNNLSGLGNELQTLEGLFGSGFLLALLVGAATDPKGLASQLVGEYQAVAQGIQTGVKDLAGLAA